MATIKITYYGMDGEGRTVKEAKADAGSKVEQALKACRAAPHLVAVCGMAAIVHFDVGSMDYGYRLLTTEPGKFHAGPQWLNCGYTTLHEARLAAFRHLIDISWSHDRDDEGFLDEVLAESRECGCPLNHSDRASLRADMIDRWGWQRRYRAFRDEGYDDHGAHALASGTPRDRVQKVFTA